MRKSLCLKIRTRTDSIVTCNKNRPLLFGTGWYYVPGIITPGTPWLKPRLIPTCLPLLPHDIGCHLRAASTSTTMSASLSYHRGNNHWVLSLLPTVSWRKKHRTYRFMKVLTFFLLRADLFSLHAWFPLESYQVPGSFWFWPPTKE